MDLFTDPLDPNTQFVDINPGIGENGLFWILPVPDNSVQVNASAGTGSLALKDLKIENYHDLFNALEDGPSKNVLLTFECRWNNPIGSAQLLRNPDPTELFVTTFSQTHAEVVWSFQGPDAAFVSDPAATSVPVWAQIGIERNGFYFS